MGRESWRAAHLLSLNPGEVEEAPHSYFFPSLGLGIVKQVFCASGYPGSVLLFSSQGLRPVRSLFTGKTTVRDWLLLLPVPFQVRWPAWKTGGGRRVDFKQTQKLAWHRSNGLSCSEISFWISSEGF